MGWVTALLAGASLGLQVATAKKNKKLMQEAEDKKLKEKKDYYARLKKISNRPMARVG